jgi:hypothetical protein
MQLSNYVEREDTYMSLLEMQAYIGKRGLVGGNGGLFTRVYITDVKKSYGNLRFLVKPIDGAGEAWVDANRVLEIVS